jgi:hypothetical protein
MALYNVPDHVRDHLLVFLDRVQFQGFKENQAFNEIIRCLAAPVEKQGHSGDQETSDH